MKVSLAPESGHLAAHQPRVIPVRQVVYSYQIPIQLLDTPPVESYLLLISGKRRWTIAYGRTRVFVVDDDHSVLSNTRLTIETHAYEVAYGIMGANVAVFKELLE